MHDMFLLFCSCRGLQPEQQYLTTIHHTKSILFIVPAATHLCTIPLKHAHATVSHPHPAKQSPKPAAKVTSTFARPRHLQVVARPPWLHVQPDAALPASPLSFHPFSSPSLLSSNPIHLQRSPQTLLLYPTARHLILHARAVLVRPQPSSLR